MRLAAKRDLTSNEEELFEFIVEFEQKNGYFPLVREMAAGIEKSTTVTHGYLRGLVDKGFIKQVSPKKFMIPREA